MSLFLYVVVDPDDYLPGTGPPFVPREVPEHWSLRRTPGEAISRWSWSRETAYERLQHCKLLTYRLTALGIGLAVLGDATLPFIYWGSDGSVNGVRLVGEALEVEYLSEIFPMLKIESVTDVADMCPGAYQYVAIT